MTCRSSSVTFVCVFEAASEQSEKLGEADQAIPMTRRS